MFPEFFPMAFSRVSHPKESLQVVTPALRTAANLVTGDDMQTDFFLRSKPWDTDWDGANGGLNHHLLADFSGFILGIHGDVFGDVFGDTLW
jgi:hypothetical protein